MTDLSKEYCLYLRKSRTDLEAEAHGEGETLARHEKALLELARRQKLPVTQCYKEIVSGETIAARPVMQRLLDDVGRGRWAGVLVMEVERLARGDTMDQGLVAQTFQYSDTKIITPLKTYDPQNEFDEEYFEFGLFMSRREYKTINRRLQRGRLESVKEGKYVANQPPYGYQRTKLSKEKGFTLLPQPKQADVVRLIFELYTTGERRQDGTRRRLGVSLIARRLNELNIPPQKGENWSASSIRDILINPVYIGKVRWNFRPAIKKMVGGKVVIERPRLGKGDCLIFDGLHEGIIDPAVFTAAQELISKNPPAPATGEKTVKNPLAGLVNCGMCGRRMVRRPIGAKEGVRDVLMCPNTACSNVSADLKMVEERILRALEDWLGGYRLQWVLPQPQEDCLLKMKKTALEKVKKERKELRQQLTAIYALLERGIYDIETFTARKKAVEERVEQTRQEKEALIKAIRFHQEQETVNREEIPEAKTLPDVYRALTTPEAKNSFIKEILSKVVYIKEKSGRWHSTPDAFTLFLYPKLPEKSNRH